MSHNLKKYTNYIIAMAIIPTLLLGALILVITTHFIYVFSKEQVRANLQDLAYISYNSFNLIYPGDYYINDGVLYKGEMQIENNNQLVDNIKEHFGVDISLFYQNTRILTSIRDDNSERIVGTMAPKQVARTVLNQGNDYFSDAVKINGKSYFGYYIPIKNTDNEIVGMMFIGRSRQVVMDSIMKNNLMISATVIAVTFCAIIVALYFSKKTIFALNETKKFLKTVASGDLTTEIDPYVLTRNDEIGDMGRFAVILKESLNEILAQDPLTGLKNRRSCDIVLVNLLHRTKVDQSCFAIAMGDIDHFKNINDTYGHLAGDQVLCKIGEIISNHIKDLGFVFRWGGEEFILIYDNLDRYEANNYLKQLQELISKEKIVYENQVIKVKMTFGLMDTNECKDIDEIINLVDSNLYIGKENGRNCIVFNK